MEDELDFVRNFDKTFHKYSRGHRKIALYGTGHVSELILDNLMSKYNFVGVLDFNSTKAELCGLKVVSKDLIQALNIDFVIIVNRNPIISENIAKRIYKEIPNLRLKYISGKTVKIKNKKDDTNIYLSKNDILEQIDKHDVISFDLFDTLLTRKLSQPDDVKNIISELAKREFGITSFVIDRIAAENKAEEVKKNSTIYDIYDLLAVKYGKSISDNLLLLEIEIEKGILIPRDELIEIFNYAIEQKKKVYISSDMYLTKEIIYELCQLNNININSENLFVSCDKKAKKSDGSLYKLLRNVNKKQKILHIGDNHYSDYVMSKKNHIDAIQITNPFNQQRQIIGETKAETLYNKIIIGLSMSKLLNSPFFEKINSLEVFGYSILGPILINWLLWIINDVKNKTNKYVYFVSRDGFFSVQLFNYLCEQFGINKQGLYLMASRAHLAYITLEPAENNLLLQPFKGNITEFLKYRLMLNEKQIEEFNNDIQMDERAYKLNSQFISHLQEDIKQQKELYKEYLNRNHFFDENEVLFVDPSYKGTTQKYLSDFTGKKIYGYYCYADLSIENKCYQNNMKAFFQEDDDQKASNSILYNWHMLFESAIMCAPTGSLMKISNDGQFICTPLAKTQECFENKEETYKGIKQFFEDFINVYKQFLFDINPNKGIPLNIYSYIVKNDRLDESIKKTFYMDSFFEDVHDLPVF